MIVVYKIFNQIVEKFVEKFIGKLISFSNQKGGWHAVGKESTLGPQAGATTDQRWVQRARTAFKQKSVHSQG